MDLNTAINLLEAVTIFCFGLSWPVAIRKSYVSRTSKGKSLFFELFLLAGYAVGIARKIIQVTALGYPVSDGIDAFIFYLGFFFYVLNFIEISVDIALYLRNARFDRMRESNINI